ncbi:MAG: hypothetical protein F4109_12260 [Gammaproteobacteria bacterium]|nr:hypothetical protein [Gammaproteobacteria bacterium]MYD02595.1 hypothetical protein [Gammaproteobacteria bacterium]MYI26193.1 hypothetical protein [Gammaproteobacteria bacterium]
MIPVRAAIAACLLALAGPAMSADTAATPQGIKSIGVLYDVDAPFGQRALSLSLIRREGDGFVYETYSRGLGLARLVIASDALESTRFVLDQDGMVRPLGYMCRSCDGRRDGLVEIAYDLDANLAVYSEKEEVLEVALDTRAMDRKSWEIQTMLDIATGRPLGVEPTQIDGGTELDDDGRPLGVEPTLEGGKLKLYSGERLGNETLSTRAGELETRKYFRQREGSENFQYIWYARELGWLPARWEIWRKDRRAVIIEAYEFAWGEDAALAMRADWLK